jgi:hypothetical protein
VGQQEGIDVNHWGARLGDRLTTAWNGCKTRILRKNGTILDEIREFDDVFALDERLDGLLTAISGDQIDMNREIRDMELWIARLRVEIATNAEKAAAIQRIRDAIAREESHFRS